LFTTIITAIITLALIFAGTFVAIKLFDLFKNDLIQALIIMSYGFFVIYLVVNLMFDIAFNAIQ
jgi:hypothetical protein